MAISRRSFIAGSAALTSLASLRSPAFASDVTWDLSDEYAANATSGMAANFFINELHNRVGDALSIVYQGGGALGFRSVDHFDAVQDGAVQSAVTLATQLGGIDPLFNLSSLPFIANSPREAYLLWQAARAEYARTFEENGMVLLWATANAPSGIHGPAPITSVDALEGLRIRTYDVNGTNTLRHAGAAPLQIAWSDLVPQLSTGGIDAVLTSAEGGELLSIWDYCSDFTELNYAMALFMCHVNRDEFDALPQDVQDTMMDLVDVCDAHNWAAMQDIVETAYSSLEGGGMTITRGADVPPEVFDHLNAAAEDVKAAWLEEAGDRGAAVLDRFETLKAEDN